MTVPPLDLDPESRRALEFDAVLDLVAGHAVTPVGARRVRGLYPSADAAVIAAEQETVEEARRFLREEGRLVPGSLPDPSRALAALDVEGLAADALDLRDLASVLAAAMDLRVRLQGPVEQDYPRLARVGRSVPDLRREARAILDHVAPDGAVLDAASPELRRIRISMGRVGSRLRHLLESFLHDPAAAPVIQDDFITQRNGRFVIPVRADAPRRVRGIVHAGSSSGATLFVEPLESVEWNNERVALAEREAEEVQRVLLGWTERLRAHRDGVMTAVEVLAEVDSLQARALFATEADAVQPVVGEEEPLELKDVRHPVLDRRLRLDGVRCVPASVRLDPEDRVLVVSGPNAGGKTVSLKTLGLAVLMAQSGIPVCAGFARLPLFRQVRADIGDHQSIEADLSTFSAHVQAVARFLRELSAPSLLLFDEIGTGTEPGEGAALAQAILEELLRDGVTAVATTHQEVLKAWAFTTEGAVSAAMEFDEKSLRPTFRVIMGAAGTSAGIEIAARLGLPGHVLDRARQRLGAVGERAETYMARLRERTIEVESLRDEWRRRRDEQEAERARIEARMRHEAERRAREAERVLREALEEFRKRSRREIEGLRDRKERARLEKTRARSEQRLRAEVSRAKAEVAEKAGAPGAAVPSRPAKPEPGARVWVRSLGREGEVRELRGDQVVVAVGRALFTAQRADLFEPPKAAPVRKKASTAGPAARPGPGMDFRDAPSHELMLIGKRVEEGVAELDKWLDRAALAGLEEVRVVHGHGTGRLRAAVRRHLAGHPLVRDHRPGAPSEGGDGATVVRLK